MEPKFLLAAFYVCVVVHCKPEDYASAKIVRNDFSLDNDGNFDFSVDTSDGFHHDAVGYTNNIGAKDESLTVEGSYSYTAPDGVVYEVHYVADNDGFHPLGHHIPQFGTVPPQIQPDAIVEVSCVAASLCGTGLG